MRASKKRMGIAGTLLMALFASVGFIQGQDNSTRRAGRITKEVRHELVMLLF